MTKLIRGVDKNYVEISGQRKHETERAILFFDGKKEVWIPKSQIEDIDVQGMVTTITIPDWLAEDKGLV